MVPPSTHVPYGLSSQRVCPIRSILQFGTGPVDCAERLVTPAFRSLKKEGSPAAAALPLHVIFFTCFISHHIAIG